MRIDYVVYGDAFSVDGVTKKIAAQISRWEATGHDVRVLFVSYAPGDPHADPAVPATVFPFSGSRGRVSATIEAARAVRRRRPDVVYMRYDWFTPPVPPMVWPIPVVVEVNTDDRQETALYGRPIRLYNLVHRAGSMPLAAGFVCVTRELMRSLGGHATGTPATVIANGVDISGSGVGAAVVDSADGGDRFAMLVGATPPPVWNGVDRVAELARALPHAQFDVIGVGASHGLGELPANITTYPKLSRERYEPLLQRATAALGPLALYRKGLDEACPLKVREYLQHGLPILTSHRDTDFFSADPWFIHRIPNRDVPLDGELAAIGAWVDRVRGRRVPRATLERVSVDAKERARLAFLEHVLRGARV